MTVELACFGLGDNVYGLDVMQVREIVRLVPVTPLPRAPELIEGVVDLRGHITPVVDLGRALGGEPVTETDQARIAVVELDELVFGLCVESAVDVLSLPAETIEETPALAAQAGYEAVKAVVRRAGAPPVLVLSLENLVERIYRSAGEGEGE